MSLPRNAFLLHAELFGSTDEFSAHDDTIAGRPIERRFNRIERVVSAFRGKLLEHRWMKQKISFELADAAALAACEMQQRCSLLPQVSNNRLALRIGIYRESAQQRISDPCAQPEEISARLLTLDNGILLSQEIFKELNSELQKIAQVNESTPGDSPVYRLDWRLEIPRAAYARMHPDAGSSLARTPGALLLLYQKQKTLMLSAEMPLITIGRALESDLVLSENRASRRHCRIEAHPEGAVLVDSSTNGTGVLFNDGEETLVRNDRFLLRNDGLLFFGRACMGERRGGTPFEICT